MKKIIFKHFYPALLFTFICTGLKAQTSAAGNTALSRLNPWKANQLVEPGNLADILKSSTLAKPNVFNIGAVEDIKGARHIGAVSNQQNEENFKNALQGLKKNTSIVIYCGCCPFTKCPNVRPAFSTLQKLGFTNVKILDLPVNLKTNWVDKGYPLASETAP
jgi:hypothetical protein